MDPYDALDPGIRAVVRLLREAGFTTTDSGDGVAKAQEIARGLALPFAHVLVRTSPDSLVAEAEVVQWLLGPLWVVEATYSTEDRTAMLFCRERL